MPRTGPQRDHYAVLGVDPSASPQQITTAYRRLVRSLHPDTSPGRPPAHDALTEVVVAYDTLHDPERRAAYDTTRGRPKGQAPRGQPVPVRVTVRRSGPTVTDSEQLHAFVRRDGPTRGECVPLRAGPTRVDLFARRDRAGWPAPLDWIFEWIWGGDPWL
ncbi:J domain-containing protein [Streptomyces chattanoogensis]|uniref:J domain-containing protein n=1 Tax=Streptomyces chattanoogensis TaxID=66876 RepID=UPI0036C7F59C